MDSPRNIFHILDLDHLKGARLTCTLSELRGAALPPYLN
jgi:hypothetical protein